MEKPPWRGLTEGVGRSCHDGMAPNGGPVVPVKSRPAAICWTSRTRAALAWARVPATAKEGANGGRGLRRGGVGRRKGKCQQPECTKKTKKTQNKRRSSISAGCVASGLVSCETIIFFVHFFSCIWGPDCVSGKPTLLPSDMSKNTIVRWHG